jgi:AraC-like DNA-binding protein
MKPILVREQNCLRTSIAFDSTEHDYFYNPLHYHPECELTLIIQSFGQRQIGDCIENFTSGDLVLVGSNLPHVWKNDEIFSGGGSNLKAQAIAVKFRPDFAGPGFFGRPEMATIRNLIEEQAPFGLKIYGELRSQVADIMLQFPIMADPDRFIQLLQILNMISRSKEYKLMASIAYRKEKIENTHRVNQVLDFIMEHYQEDLSLEKIASLIGMNKNAFCRFFKNGTRKSLFTVINEVRISKACQLLAETDMNILQICFASGFNNISGFNKTFKKYKAINPLKYRKGL